MMCVDHQGASEVAPGTRNTQAQEGASPAVGSSDPRIRDSNLRHDPEP